MNRKLAAILPVLLLAWLDAQHLAVAAQPLVVRNLGDYGEHDPVIRDSLREKIEGSVDGDTIIFEQGLWGTIFLVRPLVLDRNVAIQGPRAPILSISAGGQFRVLLISTEKKVSLQRLTLRDGYVKGNSGGGIINGGILYLQDCTLLGNTADSDSDFNYIYLGAGGAIFNDSGSDLTLDGCTISGNTANRGGGIFNFGRTFMYNSTVGGNIAAGATDIQSRGGGIYVYTGKVFIQDCTIVGNNCTDNSSDTGVGGASA